MLGTFSPPRRASDHDMNHGTHATYVPWCMPGTLTSGFLRSRWPMVRGPWHRLDASKANVILGIIHIVMCTIDIYFLTHKPNRVRTRIIYYIYIYIIEFIIGQKTYLIQDKSVDSMYILHNLEKISSQRHYLRFILAIKYQYKYHIESNSKKTRWRINTLRSSDTLTNNDGCDFRPFLRYIWFKTGIGCRHDKW